MSKRYGFIKAFEGSVRKKASRIFTIMSVAHVVDDDEAGPTPEEINMVLPNGDAYKGQWSENLPHGHGKWAWADGCTYLGEWRKGRAMGKGKFRWPSGATYKGEFKNGYINGKGTYTVPSGEKYRGYWVMNMKHGQGTNSYANGDSYNGEWRRGLQDGTGRYQWKNETCYMGQWRNGTMNGKGTMFWGNKNRYDGLWEDGCPKGNGTFKWADGSVYVGFWSTDPNEQNGTYYPSTTPTGNSDWEPQQVYLVDLKECKISSCAKISVFPSQKMPGVDYRPKSSSRVSTDHDRTSNCSWGSDVYSGGEGEYSRNTEEGLGFSQNDHDQQTRGLNPTQRILTIKRQGETISKGHKNYELMLKLQLGIRHSVGRPGPAITLDLKPSAFDPKEKVWTKFPPKGSKHTPPHQSSEFKWKDYCPIVFRTLRKLFNVDAADYMISICGNDALRELSSPGKSGSFFYLTNDDRYMIKTIKKAEVKVLIKMLPAYYNHVRSFESTLVTKFFGLHCVKVAGHAQNKVRFVIMGNLFCTDYAIHRRFDLKGSSHGRTTAKLESEIDATTTLKDLDLNLMFRLHKTWYQEFCRQVDRDCDFLEQEKIMDYSLLIGLHFRDTSGIHISKADANQHADQHPPFDPSRLSSIKLGINMPARVEKTKRRPDCETQLVGEPTGELFEVILFFGIIDILQDYDISKKLEHAYKSMQYDPTSISAVDPRQYSKRFRDFIFRVFVEDT